jgi:death on curing protein
MEPKFLQVEHVVAIHERQIAVFGGRPGIRDLGLLESAVAVPQATFGGQFLHDDVYAMAAAYAFHIAQNQPFIDGNKRAAIVAADVFLALNDVQLPTATAALHEAMIAIAERRMNKNGLASLFRSLVEPTARATPST